MRENGVLFTPVKYTFVCRAPRVSWAVLPFIMCKRKMQTILSSIFGYFLLFKLKISWLSSDLVNLNLEQIT